MSTSPAPVEGYVLPQTLTTMLFDFEGGPIESYEEFIAMARSLTIDKILALPPDEFEAIVDQACAFEHCDLFEEEGMEDEYHNDPNRYVHPHD